MKNKKNPLTRQSEKGNIVNGTELMRNKDNNFLAQKQRIFELLSDTPQPLTMLQMSEKTGILRANICRYISHLEDEGKVTLAYKSLCPLTNHRAGHYTAVRDGEQNG